MAGRHPSAQERNKRFRVPDAELDVLSCLWTMKRATTKDIRDRLARERPMAHATVATLLSRLEQKG